MITSVKASYSNGAFVPMDPARPLRGRGGDGVGGGSPNGNVGRDSGAEERVGGDCRTGPRDAEGGFQTRPCRCITRIQLPIITRHFKDFGLLEMQKEIPPEAWGDLPTDLAKNKKHYLYGHPKEEE